MGAPVLIDVPPGVIDPIEIALLEFEKDAIPMTVIRRLPSEKRA
jgi:DNA-directed RNA polymerase subunit K